MAGHAAMLPYRAGLINACSRLASGVQHAHVVGMKVTRIVRAVDARLPPERERKRTTHRRVFFDGYISFTYHLDLPGTSIAVVVLSNGPQSSPQIVVLSIPFRKKV